MKTIQTIIILFLLSFQNLFSADPDGNSLNGQPVLPCGDSWKLCGNDNVVGSGHFIGSINSADVVFKTFNQERMKISSSGIVTIGQNVIMSGNASTYKLVVDGKIGAHEVWVAADGTPWPDYVFNKDYKLKSLVELKNYISENKHLPSMPSASEVGNTGSINIGEIQTKTLKEVEEIYLQLIKMNERIIELEKQNAELMRKINSK